jgi:2-polyprenyl-3-methyl-5-hydroxy-6-metoxy-1,4-benzoquinol methylase
VSTAVQSATQGMAALRCLLCGGVDHRPVFHESGIDILRCRTCRHVFSSFPAHPHFDGFWGDEVADDEQFYWRTARSRMYQDFVERFIAGRSGRLLDMGCGLGFFLKAVTEEPDWEVHGCEISPAAVRYAREKLRLSNVICARLEDASFPEGSFDVVTLWDVLDHLRQPDPVLRHCHTLLKDGGTCFLRTPNIVVQLARARLKRLWRGVRPGVAYLQATHHAHHYSMTSVRRMLERNGFSRVEFVHLHPVEDASNAVARGVTRLSFEAVRAVALVSRGYLNFDNLFVLAHK